MRKKRAGRAGSHGRGTALPCPSGARGGASGREGLAQDIRDLVSHPHAPDAAGEPCRPFSGRRASMNCVPTRSMGTRTGERERPLLAHLPPASGLGMRRTPPVPAAYAAGYALPPLRGSSPRFASPPPAHPTPRPYAPAWGRAARRSGLREGLAQDVRGLVSHGPRLSARLARTLRPPPSSSRWSQGLCTTCPSRVPMRPWYPDVAPSR